MRHASLLEGINFTLLKKVDLLGTLMVMNPLPPQAYTKETLAKAYHWLQGQNLAIKEMATHPDILVSLYLKAKMNGEDSLERPSIQNFRNELRSLAGVLGEFEGDRSVGMVPPVVTDSVRGPFQSHLSSSPSPLNASPPPPPASPGEAPVFSSVLSPPANSAPPAAIPQAVSQPVHQAVPPPVSAQGGFELDSKSWQMIKEVRQEMNLSRDSEALRLLVSVGYKKLRSL